jgi:GNAT superfamily N-acetyltransferase
MAAASGDAAASIVAIGWATVELDRAERELGSALGAGGWQAAERDAVLGARARLGPPLATDGPRVVLLEPDTEGRLAAFLARFGEGVGAVFVERRDGIATGPDGTSAVAGSGPLGRERLLASPARGPYVLLVARRGMATIPAVAEPGQITIRPAASADATRIASLLTDEGYPAGPSDIAARLARFQRPDAAVLVAEVDGAAIGFISLAAVPRFEHDDVLVRILALVVDPGARDRGVGHLLMAAAEDFARAQGAAFLEVTAGRHRPDARRLYEALGYDATVTAYLRKRL